MIEIVPYKKNWPGEFARVGARIRAALGKTALAIHHIGSTSVPGLAAKDIIDVQLTVADLNPVFRELLEVAGFVVLEHVARDHCPPGLTLPPEELAKQMFQGTSPNVNLHVRGVGRFNQRYPLLCRDYLRSHPATMHAYAEIKRQLARYFPENVEAYYDVKDPVFDLIMAGAGEWAGVTDWMLPPSDA